MLEILCSQPKGPKIWYLSTSQTRSTVFLRLFEKWKGLKSRSAVGRVSLSGKRCEKACKRPANAYMNTESVKSLPKPLKKCVWGTTVSQLLNSGLKLEQTEQGPE